MPSTLQPGLTYRLRVGRRIEVHCAPGVHSPWSAPYLCINPTYPLPEEAFFAQLYLYVRDREDIIRRVAAPQLGIRPSDARSSTEPARTSALHAARFRNRRVCPWAHALVRTARCSLTRAEAQGQRTGPFLA